MQKVGLSSLIALLYFSLLIYSCSTKNEIDISKAIIKDEELLKANKYALYNVEKGILYMDYKSLKTGELVKFKLSFNNYGAIQYIESDVAGIQNIATLKIDSVQYNLSMTDNIYVNPPEKREPNFIFEKIILNRNNYMADKDIVLAKNIETTYLGIKCWHFMELITKTNVGELRGKLTCWQNIPLEISLGNTEINVTQIDFSRGVSADILRKYGK